MKKLLAGPGLIYFAFALLYFLWDLSTIRNIIHMDMINVVAYQVKDMFEHHLRVSDFIFDPLFPCFTSISFSLLNAYFFHLNTVLESMLGCVFLILLGYYYMNQIGKGIPGKRQKIYFALLTGFIVFGLHKWEAAFTSFFSFNVFFNLCLCFFNYFFIAKYIEEDNDSRGATPMVFFIISNLLVISDMPPYFYSYILSAIMLLVLIRMFSIVEFNGRKWNTILMVTVGLFVFTIAMTNILSRTVERTAVVSKMGNMHAFLEALRKDPIWMIKFYLIGESGPFIGEAFNHPRLRALFGLAVLMAYALAVYYVIKRKDKRLLFPLAMVFYNVISYAFVTLGRFNYSLDYGSSSRYTAFNLSGVLGLSTILFFFIAEERIKLRKAIAYAMLMGIIGGYLFVDWRQLVISPYRTIAFKSMRMSLLTGENLGILQASEASCRRAIPVLRKYGLNVYYQKRAGDGLNLDELKSVTLASGSSAFEGLMKVGFYEAENGITWTNGNASIVFDPPVKVGDSLTLEMNTYMPPICRNIYPKLSITGEDNKEYWPDRSERKADTFYYVFLDKGINFLKINIHSDTVNAYPDKRILSFPFKSLGIRK